MKKTGAILLLILFVLINSAYFLFVSYVYSEKQNFRNQAIQSWSSEVQVLNIPESLLYKNQGGLEWKDHNRELCLKGNFYEILKIITSKDQCTLLLMPDKTESDLFSHYFQNQSKHNSSFLNAFFQLFCLNYLQDHAKIEFSFVHAKQNSFNTINSILCIDYTSDLFRPPIV